MDKAAFLQKFLDTFSLCFNSKNYNIWFETYDAVIPDNLSEIDLQKLLEMLLKSVSNLKIAPSPAEVKLTLRSLQAEKEDLATLQKLEKTKKMKCSPPPPDFYEAYFEMCKTKYLKPKETMLKAYMKSIEKQDE